jgi:signal transduction histidine kinase
MSLESPPQIEDRIARCRLILSSVALVAVFIDPTQPFVSARLSLAAGRFMLDPYVLGVMGLHLAYSVVVYFAAIRHWFEPRDLARWTQWFDVGIGAGIALLTEGATSPFYAFFAFAVVVAGFRAGLRQAIVVTTANVVLYICMIAISAPDSINLYIMRPAYLAIVGYLVGYLGQQRIDLEQEIQQLEASAQRHRIARDLHDGFAQALAGINLRIEACRRLLRRNDSDDAMTELTELQESVNREYDELRAYMMGLAGIPPSAVPSNGSTATRFALNIRIDGSIDLVDHVLQIVREGLINVRRHAEAGAAQIHIASDGPHLRISIDDDGVGLQTRAAPWSIVSRVKELGGRIEVAGDQRPGAHLQIVLPQT